MALFAPVSTIEDWTTSRWRILTLYRWCIHVNSSASEAAGEWALCQGEMCFSCTVCSLFRIHRLGWGGEHWFRQGSGCGKLANPRFLQGQLAAPLTALTSTKTAFRWSSSHSYCPWSVQESLLGVGVLSRLMGLRVHLCLVWCMCGCVRKFFAMQLRWWL